MIEETRLPLIGAHLSIAGGRDKAIDRAVELECNVIQLFTHNPRQWNVPPLRDEEILLFRKKQKDAGIITFSHSSYLINLVSANREVREKSFGLFLTEIRLARALGISGLVHHPGNAGGPVSDSAIRELSGILDRAISESENDSVTILLETTPGGNGMIGSTFGQIRDIKAASHYESSIAVCFDTCHVFSSGYDIRENKYQIVFEEFDAICGLENIRLFHLNDSKGDIGSHKDRHEHIGKGALGLETFRLLMNDKRFKETAKCIETPKGTGKEFDLQNLRLLKNLAQGKDK